MHGLVTHLFVEAAQHAVGAGLRKTPLGKYMPTQAKVANEKSGGAK